MEALGTRRAELTNMESDGKGRTRVLTFVINRYHPRYEGSLAGDDAARRIASAQGVLGTNRDYLYRTVKHLAELGIEDGPMHSLEAKVRELANEPN